MCFTLIFSWYEYLVLFYICTNYINIPYVDILFGDIKLNMENTA